MEEDKYTNSEERDEIRTYSKEMFKIWKEKFTRAQVKFMLSQLNNYFDSNDCSFKKREAK
jgi:hypothetical protein